MKDRGEWLKAQAANARNERAQRKADRRAEKRQSKRLKSNTRRQEGRTAS